MRPVCSASGMNSAGGTGRASGAPTARAPRRRRSRPCRGRRSAGSTSEISPSRTARCSSAFAPAARPRGVHAGLEDGVPAPCRRPWRRTSRRRRRAGGPPRSSPRSHGEGDAETRGGLELVARDPDRPADRGDRCGRPRRATSSSSPKPSRSRANSSPPRRAALSRRAPRRRSRSATVAQHGVPGGVAERVVDRLEVVEVEEDHREAASPCAGGAPGRARPGPGTARGWAGR